jgi:hypothetical protein
MDLINSNKRKNMKIETTKNNRTKENVLLSIDKNLWNTFKPIATKYGRKYSSIVEHSIKRYVQSKE